MAGEGTKYIKNQTSKAMKKLMQNYIANSQAKKDCTLGKIDFNTKKATLPDGTQVDVDLVGEPQQYALVCPGAGIAHKAETIKNNIDGGRKLIYTAWVSTFSETSNFNSNRKFKAFITKEGSRNKWEIDLTSLNIPELNSYSFQPANTDPPDSQTGTNYGQQSNTQNTTIHVNFSPDARAIVVSAITIKQESILGFFYERFVTSQMEVLELFPFKLGPATLFVYQETVTDQILTVKVSYMLIENFRLTGDQTVTGKATVVLDTLIDLPIVNPTGFITLNAVAPGGCSFSGIPTPPGKPPGAFGYVGSAIGDFDGPHTPQTGNYPLDERPTDFGVDGTYVGTFIRADAISCRGFQANFINGKVEFFGYSERNRTITEYYVAGAQLAIGVLDNGNADCTGFAGLYASLSTSERSFYFWRFLNGALQVYDNSQIVNHANNGAYTNERQITAIVDKESSYNILRREGNQFNSPIVNLYRQQMLARADGSIVSIAEQTFQSSFNQFTAEGVQTGNKIGWWAPTTADPLVYVGTIFETASIEGDQIKFITDSQIIAGISGRVFLFKRSDTGVITEIRDTFTGIIDVLPPPGFQGLASDNPPSYVKFSDFGVY